MTFTFEQPPEHLTWYHLGPLLDAEAGTLTYDPDRYSVHGVSNNAVACCWAGLLTDGDDGMVLTDLGRTRLAEWKSSPAGVAWLAEWSAIEDEGHHEQVDVLSPSGDACGEQLGLFGEVPA